MTYDDYFNLSPQIGKEHVGLKAITEVLQDLQYKVSYCFHSILIYWISERNRRRRHRMSCLRPNETQLIWITSRADAVGQMVDEWLDSFVYNKVDYSDIL